jgi:hypothetical protein
VIDVLAVLREVATYHGTPLTPRAALLAMAGRSFCVSFARADDIAIIDQIAASIMLDNGAFSFWMAARKVGAEACEAERDWSPYYAWAERWLSGANRWAVIPDAIAMPSQLNDALINQWPLGKSQAAPVWHMDEPVSRLGRLLDQGWNRVALGWVAQSRTDNIVGSEAYMRRLDEIDSEISGMPWGETHMLRGIAVSRVRPFPQRGLNFARAKRVAIRQPYGRRPWRPLARPESLCRQIGGQV